MKPINVNELDPGIRRTVLLLRGLGFETTDSGDGRTKREAIAAGEAEAIPHVYFTVTKLADAAKALARLLDKDHGLPHWGFTVVPTGSSGGAPADAPARGDIWVQLLHDPADGSTIISVHGVSDDLLPQVET